MGEFRMPSLGADMESGTVVEWRVRPGDRVHRGDIAAVVDTEKSTIEVEIFEDGVVSELLVAPGVEVPVGTPLARVDAAPGAGGAPAAEAAFAAEARPPAREAAFAAPPPAGPPAAEAGPPVAAAAFAGPPPGGAPAAEAPVPVAVAPSPEPAGLPAAVTQPPPPPADGGARPPRPVPAAPGGFVRASPLARREAAARSLDLAGVAGTGPGGAVVLADLERAGAPAAPAAPAATPAPVGREPAARQAAMRQAVGALMARSKREVPHYYLATTVDMGGALAWLAEVNRGRPVTARLLPAALLLKATALAARDSSAMNGFWLDGFRPSPAVHLGVAVALRGGGLVAPAIHDADRLSLDDLMAALRDVVQRARAGVLRSSEMADPTITVTNLGDQGVEEVFGVIYPPQVALVGFGRIVERPWAVDGLLGVRPVVRMTLSADHRASDGHDGARFLAAVDRLLQNPEDLQ